MLYLYIYAIFILHKYIFFYFLKKMHVLSISIKCKSIKTPAITTAPKELDIRRHSFIAQVTS